jgi:hypothetical protein
MICPWNTQQKIELFTEIFMQLQQRTLIDKQSITICEEIPRLFHQYEWNAVLQ